MARETKAQREAREESERLENYKAYQKEYPERLMNALERATKLGWDISVVDCVFGVWIGKLSFKVPYAVTGLGYHYEFEDMVRAIGIAEDKLKEEERIASIRKSALEKLSEEERNALGL
jgi:hypothetical protein